MTPTDTRLMPWPTKASLQLHLTNRHSYGIGDALKARLADHERLHTDLPGWDHEHGDPEPEAEAEHVFEYEAATYTCQRCGGLVAATGLEIHDNWHDEEFELDD